MSSPHNSSLILTHPLLTQKCLWKLATVLLQSSMPQHNWAWTRAKFTHGCLWWVAWYSSCPKIAQWWWMQICFLSFSSLNLLQWVLSLSYTLLLLLFFWVGFWYINFLFRGLMNEEIFILEWDHTYFSEAKVGHWHLGLSILPSDLKSSEFIAPSIIHTHVHLLLIRFQFRALRDAALFQSSHITVLLV